MCFLLIQCFSLRTKSHDEFKFDCLYRVNHKPVTHYVMKQLDFSPVLALFSRLLESNETNNTVVAMLYSHSLKPVCRCTVPSL